MRTAVVAAITAIVLSSAPVLWQTSCPQSAPQVTAHAPAVAHTAAPHAHSALRSHGLER